MAEAQAAAPAQAQPQTVNVTYIPRENGDPHVTKVAGITFRAHAPTPVRTDATILAPIRREKEMEDGSVRSQAIETRVPLLALLKENPWFLVEGHDQAERKRGKPRLPQNPDEYRGHALRWVAASDNATVMKERMTAEQKLREDCGVTEADLAQVMPFYYARLEVLDAA